MSEDDYWPRGLPERLSAAEAADAAGSMPSRSELARDEDERRRAEARRLEAHLRGDHSLCRFASECAALRPPGWQCEDPWMAAAEGER